MKNVKNIRMCIVCRTKRNKDELIRLVKNDKNIIEVDKNKKGTGRGAYLCNNAQCINKGTSAIYLKKAFKNNINDVKDRKSVV